MKIPCRKWSAPSDWKDVNWNLPTSILVKEIGGSTSRIDCWRKKLGHRPTMDRYQREKLARYQIIAEKRRTLFLNALADGYTQSELAEILGVSRQCINQAIHNGKNKSRAKANYAMQIGLLVPSKRCHNCNRKTDTTAHHRDYSKPLDVQWLCWSCHRKAHRNKNH